MKCEAAKIVPKLLNLEKKKQRPMAITQEMLTMFNDDPDLVIKSHNWWRVMGVWPWH